MQEVTIWMMENGLLIAEWDRVELHFEPAPVPRAWLLDDKGQWLAAMLVGLA